MKLVGHGSSGFFTIHKFIWGITLHPMPTCGPTWAPQALAQSKGAMYTHIYAYMDYSLIVKHNLTSAVVTSNLLQQTCSYLISNLFSFFFFVLTTKAYFFARIFQYSRIPKCSFVLEYSEIPTKEQKSKNSKCNLRHFRWLEF